MLKDLLMDLDSLFKRSWLHRGSAHFLKGPRSKYCSLWIIHGLDSASPVVAQEPQAVSKREGRAVFRLTFICKNRWLVGYKTVLGWSGCTPRGWHEVGSMKHVDVWKVGPWIKAGLRKQNEGNACWGVSGVCSVNLRIPSPHFWG